MATLRRIATTVLLAAAAMAAWQWVLALTGSRSAPGLLLAVIPAFVAMGGAVLWLIAMMVELNRGLDWSHAADVPSVLQLPPPRNLTAGAKTRRRLVFTARLMTILILAMAHMQLPAARNVVWLQKEGVETVGHVVDRQILRSKTTSYSIYYRFPQAPHDDAENVSAARYERLHVGDAVPVTFLPRRPEISTMQRVDEISLRQVFVSGGSGPVFLGYIVLVLLISTFAGAQVVKSATRLASAGIVTIGRVTTVGRRYVSYEFDGGRGRMQRRGRLRRRQPLEGQPLAVIYDPANPKARMPVMMLDLDDEPVGPAGAPIPQQG